LRARRTNEQEQALLAAQQHWDSTYSRVRSPSWIVRSLRPCIVVGWLLMACAVVSLYSALVPSEIGTIVLVIAISGVAAGLLLWGVAVEHEDHVLRTNRHALCKKCHYPLGGLEDSGACPECGSGFEMSETVGFWTGYARCRDEIQRLRRQS
jgi:hypothetical protein